MNVILSEIAASDDKLLSFDRRNSKFSVNTSRAAWLYDNIGARYGFVANKSHFHRVAANRFRDRYRGTAFYRPGRDGMLRNLAVGLGNTGDEAARPTLERLAADRSELVAEHARWGLEVLGERPGR